MENKNLFEIATKNKLRFPFKGEISVEDLWDLNLTNLDKVYTELNTERNKIRTTESLIREKSKEEEVLDIKIAIVRYIFVVKTDEAALKAAEKDRKAEKQKIMEIIQKKKDENLANMSLEELQALLATK